MVVERMSTCEDVVELAKERFPVAEAIGRGTRTDRQGNTSEGHWSDWAIRPAHLGDSVYAGLFVFEVPNGFLECFWLVHVAPLVRIYQKHRD